MIWGGGSMTGCKLQQLVMQCSPHVQQVFLNPNAGYVCRTDIPFSRVLAPDAPRAPYRRRKDEVKTVIHWGQRKLLLSEIEFLTPYVNGTHTVVYAGAAPGTHIRHLASLFPDLTFVLIDPAPFTVRESNRIKIINSHLTDDLASLYSGEGVLFISDVRSVDWSELPEEETDLRIRADQEAQMRWHQLMRPKASMLKFRLPWTPGQTTYLDGQVYLPVWGPITTTESRLIVHGDASTRVFDNEKYMEQLFYFNTVTRVAVYPHDVVNGGGLDNCYDCCAEIFIIGEYLSKIRTTQPRPCDIAKMSSKISRELGRDRTLLSPNVDPEERKNQIRSRQWVNGAPAYESTRISSDRPDLSDALNP